MAEDTAALVQRLFDALNRGDAGAIAALCDEGVEFFLNAEGAFGRSSPYRGAEGLGAYVADLSRSWEEILITPCEVDRKREVVLVQGRVYVRSHELGIRDVPVAWIWKLRDGRFVRGEVFPDPREAEARFAAAPV